MAQPTNSPQIPALTDASAAGVKSWSRQVVAAIARISGQSARTNNAALDEAVTFRQLIDAGFAIQAPSGSAVPITPPGSSITPPPAPTGFTVVRLAFNMRLEWDAPVYSNHLYTEVYRSASNNLTTAEPIMQVPAGVNLYEDGFVEGAAWYYWIRFVSEALVPGAFNSLIGTADNAAPADVTGFTYELSGFDIKLRWNKNADSDIDVYQLSYGATIETSVLIDEVKGTSLSWKPQATGTYHVFIRARDVTGYYSASATAIDVTVAPPGTAAISFVFSGGNVSLSWAVTPGSFAIDFYEIRVGSTWAGATLLDKTFSTNYQQRVDWSLTRTFWVAARDIAGNYATPAPIDVLVVAPGAVASFRAEVVDNNVLLFWTAPSIGSIPVDTYELKEGSTFAGSTLIGEKSGLFTSVFEQSSGSYTYWVRAKDAAGTYGPETGVTATVNQPPDYVLYDNRDIAPSTGTLTNALVDGTTLVMPFNTTQTWDQNYTANAWTNDQDAISASYPYYAEITPTTSLAVFTIDYGGTIPPTAVDTSASMVTITGTPVVTTVISWATAAAPTTWTALAAGTSGFVGASFRYIKVEITVAGSGDDFVVFSNLNVRLNTKQRTDSGQGTANSGDAGGTTFTLNYPFIDLLGPPVVQPKGTSAIIPVVDFTDAPNPTTFKVLLFNLSGSRVTADISWIARGV